MSKQNNLSLIISNNLFRMFKFFAKNINFNYVLNLDNITFSNREFDGTEVYNLSGYFVGNTKSNNSSVLIAKPTNNIPEYFKIYLKKTNDSKTLILRKDKTSQELLSIEYIETSEKLICKSGNVVIEFKMPLDYDCEDLFESASEVKASYLSNGAQKNIVSFSMDNDYHNIYETTTETDSYGIDKNVNVSYLFDSYKKVYSLSLKDCSENLKNNLSVSQVRKESISTFLDNFKKNVSEEEYRKYSKLFIASMLIILDKMSNIELKSNRNDNNQANYSYMELLEHEIERLEQEVANEVELLSFKYKRILELKRSIEELKSSLNELRELDDVSQMRLIK